MRWRAPVACIALLVALLGAAAPCCATRALRTQPEGAASLLEGTTHAVASEDEAEREAEQVSVQEVQQIEELFGALEQEPSKAMLDASKDYFLFQWVGVQDAGQPQPRSPLHKKANMCLTAGINDGMAGMALMWEVCQDAYISPDKKLDVAMREAQLFQLTLSGLVRGKYSGKCVRRAKCDGGDAYDLGSCDEPNVIRFLVKKSIANSITHLKPYGAPIQAVATDECDLCGPYQLSDRCHGGSRTRGHADDVCSAMWKAVPGWTKMSTQYIGDMHQSIPTFQGGAKEFTEEVIQRAAGGGKFAFGETRSNNQLTGLGRTDKNGICGSFVADAPALSSYFYLIKDLGHGR